MLKAIQYNLTISAYLSLLVDISENVTKHVEELKKNGLPVKHPSQVQLYARQVKQIEFLFPTESKYFDGGANYFNSVVLANYHIGSLRLVKEQFPGFSNFSDIAGSILISVEDILILTSFKTI